MKTEITVDWSPLKTLIKRFPQEAKNAIPLALNTAANELLNATDEAFTNPNNRQKAWPPLNPKTIARKPANSSILVNTGFLKQHSLRRLVDAPNNIIGIQFSCKYAATHQFGRDHIPARPFVPITETGDISPKHIKTQVLQAFSSAIERALQKHLSSPQNQ